MTSELFSLLLKITEVRSQKSEVRSQKSTPEVFESGVRYSESEVWTPDNGLQTPDFRLLCSDLPLAVVPLNEEGEFEPLCAIYSTAALETVSRLIAAGVRKVSLLFEQVPCRIVRFDEIKHLRNSAFFFENINTPQDFAQAIKKIGSRI